MEKLPLDALARELMKSATALRPAGAHVLAYGGYEHVLRQDADGVDRWVVDALNIENPGEATVQVGQAVGCGWLLTP